MAEALSPRVAAVNALSDVLHQGLSLSVALPARLAAAEPSGRALAQELCYGTLRWRLRLEALLDRLLQRPLKARDRDLRQLLLIGLYQLIYLSIPAHAAVTGSVDAAEELGKPWARGLVNGLLRNFLRRKEELLRAVDAEEEAALSHPRWLLEEIKAAWPRRWREIAEAGNRRPPMTLRVNLLQGTREQYLDALRAEGIAARPAAHAPAAVTLDQPLPVERLPGFAEGRVSVQDAAAQLAATILAPEPRERVLDACAAPGGKTGHLLESARGVRVEAIDREPLRLRKVAENLARLRLEARLLAVDAAAPEGWWDGEAYDRILLDAPCSATGVIRRHPDIKSLRRPEDIPELVKEQERLLEALWPLLRPGGILLYATCSILPEENERQIVPFLARHPDARESPIDATWGVAAAAGRQILPGDDDMDGFFYARLAKV